MSSPLPELPQETEEPWLQGQVVLILCGLIASGKSTFAQQLQHHYPRFHRCNQDDLGDRRRVEHLARDMLSQGMSVCIDRTNFNASQRSYWIEIAREFPGTSIWVIVFDAPYEVCAARLQTRTSHPTIKSPEQGLAVLSRFAADFQYPVPHEGFDRIISLKPKDHMSPIYSRPQIAAILQRVHDSPLVSSGNSEFRSFRGRQSFRGHPVRGDSGASNARLHRGCGRAPIWSMNEYPHRVLSCASSLHGETTHVQADKYGRFASSDQGRSRTAEVRSHSDTTLGSASGGTGTAQDPFTLQ